MARGLIGARSTSQLGAAVATYGTNAAVAALGLVNVIVVSRALGATGRGDVALLIAIPTLCSYLATLGVQESNANLGAAEPRSRPGLATNSLVLGATLGAGASLLIAVAIALVPAIGGEAPRGLHWVALCCVPLMITKMYLNPLLQSDHRFAITNLAWLVGPVITSSGNGLMALTGDLTVGSAIALWVCGQGVGVSVLAIHTGRQFGFGRPDSRLARRALRFGLRTHIGHTMSVGNWRLDQWLVGAMSGSKQLGYYSVAAAWAELLFYVPGVIVLVQRPELVRASRAEAARRAAAIMRRALVLAALAGIGLLVASPLLCTAVFGAEFAGATPQLQVLALGAFGIVVLELLSNALIAQRRALQASAAIAVAAMTTIVLDLLLIPPYGGLGAAIATTGSYTVGAVAVGVVFCRQLGARPGSLIPRSGDLAWFWHRARPPGRALPARRHVGDDG